MDSSHVATGAITALVATALVYLSHWPLQPLDLPTASAFAGARRRWRSRCQILQIQDRVGCRANRPSAVDHFNECGA